MFFILSPLLRRLGPREKPKVTHLVAGLNARPLKSLVSVLSTVWQLEFNYTVSFSQTQWYLIDFSKTEELGSLNFHSSRQCDSEQIIITGKEVNGAMSWIHLLYNQVMTSMGFLNTRWHINMKYCQQYSIERVHVVIDEHVGLYIILHVLRLWELSKGNTYWEIHVWTWTQPRDVSVSRLEVCLKKKCLVWPNTDLVGGRRLEETCS